MSILCANAIIDEILERGGKALYSKYIDAKILPFAILRIIEDMKTVNRIRVIHD